jgi:hypothetical protein
MNNEIIAIMIIAMILVIFPYIIWQEIQIKKLKEKCEQQIRAEREWACMVRDMHGKKKQWYEM